MSIPTIIIFYRIASLLLLLALFTVGSVPAVGQAFTGPTHWLVHLAAYALIAVTFGLGWQNVRLAFVVAIVFTIGAFHELTEIITHNHGFEFNDAVVNGLGALIGVAVVYLLRNFGQKEKPPSYL